MIFVACDTGNPCSSVGICRPVLAVGPGRGLGRSPRECGRGAPGGPVGAPIEIPCPPTTFTEEREPTPMPPARSARERVLLRELTPHARAHAEQLLREVPLLRITSG